MRVENVRRLNRTASAGIAILLVPATVALAAGPVDQQWLASGQSGTDCGAGPGHLVQSVTPGAYCWETVRLHLNRGDATGEVTLVVRSGAPDGPELARTATDLPPTAPRESFWADFSFTPPVCVTPGEPAFLDLETRDSIGIAASLTDPYPGGTLWTKCSFDSEFRMSTRADAGFSTHVPDRVDQEWLASGQSGTDCGAGPGHFVQSVTPGSYCWEIVRLHLNRGDATGEVTLVVRSGAPDGPELARAATSLPSTAPREFFWAEFSFTPPIRVTPGEPVFLDLETRDSIGIAASLTNPYPGGTQWTKCSFNNRFRRSNRADMGFSTQTPDPFTTGCCGGAFETSP